MRLFEHPDFEQAIIRAADHFRPRGLREAIIEKDYYVTEALRIIEQAAGHQVIFKGGTSLSKGWGLIQRFSEDIDIFLDPTAFDPPLGKKGIDRELKKLRQVIEQHPALTFVEKESQTIGGFGRNDRFEYVQRFAGAGEIRNRVFVESRHRQRPGTDRTRPAAVLRGAIPRGERGHPGCRRRRPVRDAAAPFPPHFRREDVRDPREGRGVQERGPADRRLRPPLLRPLLPGPAPGGTGDAPLRGIRGYQGRLRPDQHRPFPEELRAAARHDLCKKRRPVPTGRTPCDHRRRIRGPMPRAVFRSLPHLG